MHWRRCFATSGLSLPTAILLLARHPADLVSSLLPAGPTPRIRSVSASSRSSSAARSAPSRRPTSSSVAASIPPERLSAPRRTVRHCTYAPSVCPFPRMCHPTVPEAIRKAVPCSASCAISGLGFLSALVAAELSTRPRWLGTAQRKQRRRRQPAIVGRRPGRVRSVLTSSMLAPLRASSVPAVRLLRHTPALSAPRLPVEPLRYTSSTSFSLPTPPRSSDMPHPSSSALSSLGSGQVQWRDHCRLGVARDHRRPLPTTAVKEAHVERPLIPLIALLGRHVRRSFLL